MEVVQPRVDFTPSLAVVRAEQLRRQVGRRFPSPKTTGKTEWPPDYSKVLAWRSRQLALFEQQPELIESAKAYYKKPEHCVEFINHWCTTYDPRNLSKGLPTSFPFILFPRQEELVEFVLACFKGEAPGLVEKSRDMGATWTCIGISVWLWLFHEGAAIGWGSNKQEQVDKLGSPSTIFEKIRMLIRALPKVFLPPSLAENQHMFFMRILNPDNGATITGEIGDNIGRGGRTAVYFVDEAAHLEHPEAVEASLSETTRVRIDISSVSGLGTVFYRKRSVGDEWHVGGLVHQHRTNVFIMDWSDHPGRTQEWYDGHKSYYVLNGLAHVFAREIDRDYSAAVEGVIIPQAWVRAAFDAHIALGFDDSGAWTAGLDVADGGLDKNALAMRKGSVLKHLDKWTERDAGVSARKTVRLAALHTPIEVQYDSVGIGSTVKAEINRLAIDEGILPKGVSFVAWNAGATPLHPHMRVLSDDPKSAKNTDFFSNLKAQAWWQVARRFERTWRAREDLKEGKDISGYDPEDLISIDTESLGPIHRELAKELSQAVMAQSARLKLMIDKAPEGASSPNLADAVIMAFWPWKGPVAPRIGLIAPMVLRTH